MSYDCRIQTVGPSTHSLYITAARSLCSAAYGFVAECASIHYVSAFNNIVKWLHSELTLWRSTFTCTASIMSIPIEFQFFSLYKKMKLFHPRNQNNPTLFPNSFILFKILIFQKNTKLQHS